MFELALELLFPPLPLPGLLGLRPRFLPAIEVEPPLVLPPFFDAREEDESLSFSESDASLSLCGGFFLANDFGFGPGLS